MQHSLVINTYVDHIYIKHGVEFYLGFCDRYHSKILKETDAHFAAWLFEQYKYYMHLLIEGAYKLMSKGSVDNHQKITNLVDTIYFMYAQAYEHTLALTLKRIS